jgi:LysM repeat protein
MLLSRTARFAAGLAAVCFLASGCLLVSPARGSNGQSQSSNDVSFGEWRSKTIRPERPGLPNAVRDSFSEPGTKGRYYVVKKGDTLAAISRRFYGDTKFWKSIHNANQRAISNPNALEPGVNLRIP